MRKLILLFMLSTSAYAASPEFNPKLDYENYMRELIKLSQQNPHYPFAAMIIENETGKVLCSGVNQSAKNPTFHGEMVAMNNCLAKHPTFDWSRTTLITDAEPCAMCSGAMVWMKIPRLVYGSSVPDLLSLGWDQINVRAQYVFDGYPQLQFAIKGNVLHEETNKLFANARMLKTHRLR